MRKTIENTFAVLFYLIVYMTIAILSLSMQIMSITLVASMFLSYSQIAGFVQAFAQAML